MSDVTNLRCFGDLFFVVEDVGTVGFGNIRSTNEVGPNVEFNIVGSSLRSSTADDTVGVPERFQARGIEGF